MATDLITVSRATQNATLLALNTSNPAYLASLISAASAAIEQYCLRTFSQSTYSEYYDGHLYVDQPIRLRQYPVLEISRIATNPTPAILISNTGSSVQRATIETTATGVKVVTVASGVSTATTPLYATYVTLNALAAAITAIGSGFTATVQTAPNINLGLFPSADLAPLQGAMTTIGGNGAYLYVYLEDLQPFSFTSDYGFGGGLSSRYGWRLDDAAGQIHGRFPRGTRNLRIDYTAGYATIPQDIQEACVSLVQHRYQTSQVNSALKSAQLGNASFVIADLKKIPGDVMQVLNYYRDGSKITASS